MIVTVRSQEDGKKVWEIISAFAAERSLALSEEKTKICHVEDGFTFLGHTYVKRNSVMYAYPSEQSIETFIGNITSFIETHKKSQRDLILKINEKLKGWAGYHRFTDAEDAFRRVDAAVQAALLSKAIQKHPKWPNGRIIAKYWYEEPDGRHCYALPNDKSVRVIRLQDTLLIVHNRIRTNINPYIITRPHQCPAKVESRLYPRLIHRFSGGDQGESGLPLLAVRTLPRQQSSR